MASDRTPAERCRDAGLDADRGLWPYGDAKKNLALQLLKAFVDGTAGDEDRRLAADLVACHEGLCDECLAELPCDDCWNDGPIDYPLHH